MVLGSPARAYRSASLFGSMPLPSAMVKLVAPCGRSTWNQVYEPAVPERPDSGRPFVSVLARVRAPPPKGRERLDMDVAGGAASGVAAGPPQAAASRKRTRVLRNI